ncbi:MAG: molybdopterin biosynthesis protein [Deltaproteobacteria bacterium]|nr:molybdopterin biosynthesis protein [Deltaproteobacteria bacterium]MBW2219083.1 molybdopterin biosynthesis protein [Deltaproteobacteria bacterium]
MTLKRNIYLDMKTLEKAREILFTSFPLSSFLTKESVPVADAVGRVLAEAVFAKISSPPFHAAAMDGIAIKASDSFGAAENHPIEFISDKNAFYVNTGHVLPENTDAVIMIEYVNRKDDKRLEIESPAYPWQNIRKLGEDIVATELLFPVNHKVTPYCIGALLSAGITSVEVKKKPKGLIVPTGSELIDADSALSVGLKPGQLIESNSHVLAKLIESYGGAFERKGIIRDDIGQIEKIISDAAEDKNCNFILICGGSSAGSHDFSKASINNLGTILVHGVTIMPGKPVIIADVNGKPVFGVPGYPVSTIIAFEQFIGPMIAMMLGQSDKEKTTINVELTRKAASKLGIEEFLRVKLGKIGKRIVATSLPRGAGSITTITEADGIIRIPNHIEGLNAHEPVKAELLRPLASIENTIIATGSHDNTLDVLADLLKASGTGITLSSNHVGSMGGLMAIKKKVCHIAGSHLLDTEDGSYNISWIKKYLPGINIKLVNLVSREQGLIVKSGNPKNIRSLEDIAKDDIMFINRQAGSGTRILLDYRLKNYGIDPSKIKGYENEEFTHMSVAAAVLSGAADTGLGIHAAATALDLDFIPVVTEQYDLVIPKEHFKTEMIQKLLDIINTDTFKSRVRALGGYGTENTGKLINEIT